VLLLQSSYFVLFGPGLERAESFYELSLGQVHRPICSCPKR
jgi:hypothetical protein